MKQLRTTRSEPAKVTRSFRLPPFTSRAFDRWLIINKTKQTAVHTKAVEALPGMAQLIQEEKEAYATIRNQETKRFEDIRRATNTS